MRTIEAFNLRKEFGSVIAVKDVNFSLEQGQVLGLIGPNGAGKTTLLRTLATLLRPTSGNAEILGYNLTKDYLSIRKHIGFMPDFFNLYSDLTAEECLHFFARAYKIPSESIGEKIDQALEYGNLQDKRKTFIRNLSRGMVQRMGVCALLVHEPDVFLLDEPASGLDPQARIQLRDVLKKLADDGKTIIISSHILTELSGFCSHIAIMDLGKIVLCGDVDNIQKKIAESRKIVISVIDDLDKATELVRKFPNTAVTCSSNKTITLEFKDTLEKLAELNTHLIKNGIKVIHFAEEKTDLEDLFMKISATDYKMQQKDAEN